MTRTHSHVPTYRLHKQASQVVVTLPDGLRNRRDVLLGGYNVTESRQGDARVIAEWEAGGHAPPRSEEQAADEASKRKTSGKDKQKRKDR